MRRPNTEEIFKRHKKFFAKARNAQYLKDNFIGDLKEVFLRKDSSLIMQAEEFLSNKVKLRVQRIEYENKPAISWDFGSGEHKKPEA